MDPKPYDRLLKGVRRRESRVAGRNLEEEADADRGRVMFSAPFRRLQNKAQVFSLESNAAVRSRLTHSLEVASIGRYVALEALKAFTPEEKVTLGLKRRDLALITFVETACLLHDLGNPPFGHFGEIAISDWFHLKAEQLAPPAFGGTVASLWSKHYSDFRNFDGNPQGFRIITKLQPSEPHDMYGLNLTVTTLASALKYPWAADRIGDKSDNPSIPRRKAGYFQTEKEVVDWIAKSLGISHGNRHPLVYLMEAADDIAYCASDIEDGLEKGLITAAQFGEYMIKHLSAAGKSIFFKSSIDKDVQEIENALKVLSRITTGKNDQTVERLAAMNDFRSAVIRFLARHAGIAYHARHHDILNGTAGSLLHDCEGAPLLDGLKQFASSFLYSSMIVRNREITAQAVLSGLLDAYLPLMTCDLARFKETLLGRHRDAAGRPIARESGLIERLPSKYRAVYEEEVRVMNENMKDDDSGARDAMERIYRIRLIVDYISGMTDEFALQSFQLISGMQINPYRN